jgi:hypothetical protein
MMYSIPQLSGSVEYARDMEDAAVIDWLAAGGTVGLGDNPLTAADIQHFMQLWYRALLKRLDRRIETARIELRRNYDRKRYQAGHHFPKLDYAAKRAAFAPPDELAFIAPRARASLATFGINSLDALLALPREWYMGAVGWRELESIEAALRSRSLKLHHR